MFSAEFKTEGSYGVCVCFILHVFIYLFVHLSVYISVYCLSVSVLPSIYSFIGWHLLIFIFACLLVCLFLDW